MDFRGLIEALPAGVLAFDKDGRCAFANQGWTLLTGLSAEASRDEGWLAAIAPDDRTTVGLRVRTAAQAGSANPLMVRLGAAPQVRQARARVQPIGDGSYLLVIEDDEERRRSEEAHLAALSRAEEASRLKSEFVANMSHEIRNPMNAILGMADLLSATPLDAQQKRYVQSLRTASDHLIGVLDAVLDLSRIESGRLELEEVDFNLREVAERTLELLGVRARRKGLTLACRLPEDVPVRLSGDAQRLRQVLVNLLGNAVKFTERGEIVLSVQHDPESDEPGALRFSVSDTGPGIPEDKREAIFETFVQGDPSTTRRFGGTGLGLSIARRLVGLMGGRIWVESEVGRGSTFHFTARFRTHERDAEGPAATSLQGLRALIIADSATQRLILREMLAGWSVVVEEAADVRIGIDRVQRAAESEQPYAVVVIDDHMLELDGLTIAGYLSEVLEEKTPPFVLVSAQSRPAEAAQLAALRVASQVQKPVRRRELMAALAQAAQTAPPGSRVTPPSPALDPRPLRILVVDDAEDNRLLVETYLEDSPYQLEFAADGREALAKVSGGGGYDLVLMDIQMPVMDGLEATREIRAWERAQGRAPVPIVALTAHALEEHKGKSVDAGMSGHLVKPVRRPALVDAILRYARTGEPAPPPARQAPEVVVDKRLSALVPGFLRGRRDDVRVIGDALRRGDFDSVAQVGHTMKGLGGSYGFPFVSDAGAALESAGKAKDPALAQRWLDALSRFLDEVQIRTA